MFVKSVNVKDHNPTELEKVIQNQMLDTFETIKSFTQIEKLNAHFVQMESELVKLYDQVKIKTPQPNQNRENRLCETPTVSRNNGEMQTRQSQTPNILKKDGKKGNLIMTDATNLPSSDSIVNFLGRKQNPDETQVMTNSGNNTQV